MQQLLQNLQLKKQVSASQDYRKITIPNHQRHKTDFLCFWLYWLISLFLLGVFFYSFITEKDQKLMRPRDPDGNICGKELAEGYPYIYFPDPITVDNLQRSTCVRKCPHGSEQELDCLTNSLVKSCKINKDPNPNKSFNIYRTDRLSVLALCRPHEQTLVRPIYHYIHIENAYNTLESLYRARYVIALVCPIVTMVFILLYVYLSVMVPDLRYLYGVVVVANFGMFGYLAYWLYYSGYQRFGTPAHIIAVALLSVMALAALALLYSVSFGRNIFRRILMLKFAAKYIRQNFLVIILSVASFVVWSIQFVVWLTVFFYIFAITDEKNDNYKENGFAYSTDLQHSIFITACLFLAILHFIWTNMIIYSFFGYLAYASSSNWMLKFPNYFNLALYRAFRYHLGTIMFGALVLPIFSWITELFYILMPSNDGKFFCIPCGCCLPFYHSSLFLKFFGIFSERNYIATNLLGQKFSRAGQSLSPITVQNISLINYAYKITKAFVVLARVFIAFVTTIVCYSVMLWFQMRISLVTNIILFGISLILASFVSSSYEKTYQSMLFTVFLADARLKKMTEEGHILEYLVNAIRISKDNPRETFKAVQMWFQHEVEEQQQMQLP